jgi:Zn finger protein HypA/HybF involved in hydrogenase expression
MENLAGALGHMTTDQASIVRVIVLNDGRELRHVMARVYEMLDGKLTTADRAKLSQIIVRSVIMPSLCHSCEGHAQYHQGDLVVVCPTCNGTGKRVAHGHEYAIASGIKAKDWHYFNDEYERCRSVLFGWISGACKVMHEEISD